MQYMYGKDSHFKYRKFSVVITSKFEFLLLLKSHFSDRVTQDIG